MRKEIEIGPLGVVALTAPRPSVAYDIISTWSASPSRAHMGRLAAAALGICGNDRSFPRYDSDQARPLAYGGLMLDHLIARGLSPNDILETGMVILGEMAPLLIGKEEVKKKPTDTEARPLDG